MTSKARPGNQTVTKTISINAVAAKVWEALTRTELMKQWMAEEEITIVTDWKVGGPIVIKGELHWVPFENRGTVLQYEEEKTLKYSHLSSLSHLKDEPESYTTIGFELEPEAGGTMLTVSLSGFPTETILKHIEFYWAVTLEILKNFVENGFSNKG